MGIGINISFGISQSITPELDMMRRNLVGIKNELSEIKNELDGIHRVKERIGAVRLSDALGNRTKSIAEPLQLNAAAPTKATEGIVALKNEVVKTEGSVEKLSGELKDIAAPVKAIEGVDKLKNETVKTEGSVEKLSGELKDIAAPVKAIEGVDKLKNETVKTEGSVEKLSGELKDIAAPVKAIKGVDKLKNETVKTEGSVEKLSGELKDVAAPTKALKGIARLKGKTDGLKNSLKSDGITQKFFGFFKKGGQKARDGLEGIAKGNNKLFSAIGDQFPQLGRFAKLLSNPYVLAAAAAVAAIVATVKLAQHLTQVSQSIQRTKRDVMFATGATGKELKVLTSQATALKKEFSGINPDEFMDAAKAMTKEFRISGKEAFKLLKQGLQGTNGKLDLDQLKEYSTQLKGVGMTADQSMALVVKAFQEGVRQDKAPDLFKEAKQRLQEMPKTASDALNKIGDKFGKLPEKLQGVSKAGKKFGITTVQGFKGALAKGEIDVVTSVQAITRAMAKLNVKDRAEITANIFGSPGEDAGERFLLSLGKAELSMKKLVNTQDPYIKKQDARLKLEERIVGVQQSFAPDFNKLKSGWDTVVQKARLLFYKVIAGGMNILRDAFGGSGTSLMQGFGGALDWLGNVFRAIRPAIITTIQAIKGVFAVIGFLLKPIFWLIGLIKRLVWDTGALQTIFKVATVTLGLLINPVLGIIVLFTRLWNKSIKLRATMVGIKNVVKGLISPFRHLGTAIMGIMEFNPIKIKNALSSAWSEIKKMNPQKDFKTGYDGVISDEAKRAKAAAAAAKKAKTEKTKPKTPGAATTTNPGAGAAATPGSSSAPPPSPGNMIGGGSKVENKNLTINIGNLIENVTIQATNMTEGAQDVEAILKEALIRAIRNTEAIY